jgi:hypothetical protein
LWRNYGDETVLADLIRAGYVRELPDGDISNWEKPGSETVSGSDSPEK